MLYEINNFNTILGGETVQIFMGYRNVLTLERFVNEMTYWNFSEMELV